MAGSGAGGKAPICLAIVFAPRAGTTNATYPVLSN